MLAGETRAEIVERALRAGSFPAALRELRAGMRSHVFRAAVEPLDLSRLVRSLDARTRKDGFHVLLEWDGRERRFVRETIPVLMVDYIARAERRAQPDPTCLAVLLDFYFLYVVALLLMRSWDEGDANANLDRVTQLLGHLQGARGSGLQLVSHAEALLFVAISHYEPDEKAYDRLLAKVETLDEAHRERIALMGAPVLGNHLRWGLEAYYQRNVSLMRADNGTDYPWLLFSLVTLMRAWTRLRREGTGGAARDHLVGCLLNGLTPDPLALLHEPPDGLSERGPDVEAFRTLFTRHREELLQEFRRHRPSERAYSPLAFHFNFPHNVLTPMVSLALLGGGAPNLPLDALFGTVPEGTPLSGSPELLARMLMEFGMASPERIGERQVVMIVYEPSFGLASFERALALLEEAGEPPASG